ncbi:DNA polymerase [Streptomyces buecherae]|uniref:DNA polymerase n=1 Tax=Streptomyces buecherae TaxID=2763006 RepID=UPI001E55ED22|nr:DNA polymerase [Streptomyces buecherae]
MNINVVESAEDLIAFRRFVETHGEFLGFDTETTGLDWWAEDFSVRLVQFGHATETYVLPVEADPEFGRAVVWALEYARFLIAHNGKFDLHVIERCYGVPMERLAPKLWDTQLLAHLVDPRAVKEGGPGLKLEELVKHYIDATAAEEVKGSMRELAKKYKTTKDKIWRLVDLWDEDYQRYAGMDPAWAYRLFGILYPLVPARSRARGLIGWEHRLAHVMGLVERTGYLVDGDYAQAQSDKLAADKAHWEEVARSYGVENPNSNAQLAEALKGFGFELTKRTPKGQLAVDDSVLNSIDHPLAKAVLSAKKAGKWKVTWFDRALAGRDAQGRVHPSINSLYARSARMSITGSIPAQTFPAGDGYVRHSFLAEEDHVTVTIDFGNMELRVMAAASGDPVMLDAFRNNADLHNLTAIAAFGPMPEGATKHPKRKAGKGTNFTVGFGGGWRAVSSQWGIPEEDAKAAVKAFWDTYKGVKAFADRLSAEARKTGYIYTATGRKLPVDKGRPYAALNYYIQSSARDITARAILELHKAGYTPWIRLPVHDELVFSFPRERAAELAEKAARIMEFVFQGLLIPAEAEIGERSWGSVLDLETSKH